MKALVTASALLLTPVLVHAQGLQGVLGVFSDLINLAIPLVIALAVLLFFWGLATYIMKAGEEKEQGRDLMIWGIIALFVMVSIWGLVRLLQDTFNVGDQTPIIPGQIR
ncbi:MAG: hypothetical protein OQJ98_01635 [Candidatus Pacebacteria bacterium]|nr:hypothetical protein [Candidatus Paceibacterota bacterium]